MTVFATAGILTYFNTKIQENFAINESFSIKTDTTLHLTAKSNSSKNPLLIVFHGGPSLPTMPFSGLIDAQLQEHFIVVHWDQRGAGKSFSSSQSASSMTLENMISDSEAILNACLEKYNKSQAIVLSHSWGSILAAHVAARNPEKIKHYLAFGQLVNLKKATMYSYEFALKEAKKNNNQTAIADLKGTHNPPKDFNELNIQRVWLTEFGGFIKGKSFQEFGQLYFGTIAQNGIYTSSEAQSVIPSLEFSIKALWENLFTLDISELAPKLTMPSTFFVGEYDAAAPKQLLLPFYEKVSGPKELYEVEASSHFILLSDPEKFQSLVINAVN